MASNSVNPQLGVANEPDYERKSQGAIVGDSLKPRGQEANTILPEGVRIADRSAEYTGQAASYGMQAQATGDKNFADIFGAVVAGADYLTKTGTSLLTNAIDRKVYDVANAEREREIVTLNQIQSGAIKDKSLMDAHAEATDADIPPSVKEDVNGTVQTLAGLKEFNKLSRTDYLARQLDNAKELRAQYPGYKQYIDNKFKEVLGTDIANSYIAGKIQDINKASQTLNSERNRTINNLMRSSMPGAEDMLAGFMKGTVGADQVNYAITQHNSTLGKMDLFKKTREMIDIGTAARGEAAQKELDYGLSSEINAQLKTFRIKLGGGKEISADEFVAQADNFTTQQAGAAADQIATLRKTIQSKWIANSMAPGRDGRTLNEDLGGSEKRDAQMKKSLAYLDSIEKDLRNKDFGPVGRTTRQLQASQDDMRAQIRDLPGVGTYLEMEKALRDYGADPKTFALDGMGAAGVGKLRELAEKNIMAMQTQLSRDKTGKPTTLNTVLDNAAENGIKSPSYVSSILDDVVNKLGGNSTNGEAKRRLGVAMFSPENRGVIARLNKDGYDAQGRFVPGQWFTYNRLTSDDIAEGMHKEGGSNWGNYRSWAQTEFRSLFVREIKDMNASADNQYLQYGWDTDKQNLTVRLSKGIGSQTFLANAQQNVAKINAGLDRQKTIAKLSGNPLGIEGYMTDLLTNSGWTPTEKTSGLPAQLRDAIRASREDQAKETSRREFDAGTFYGRMRDK